MITCRELVEQLGDLVDGGLPPEAHAALERHLEGCPCCRAYLDSYRMTMALGRHLPCPALPAGLARRLKALLEGK